MYHNPKVNFQEKELFQYRFKREPKEWSLEDIHDLWIRSIQRNEKYYFAVDDQHRYSYKKFHFRGEVNDPIKL